MDKWEREEWESGPPEDKSERLQGIRDLSDIPIKNPEPLTEHYFPPWCVSDRRRKCPEETTFCDSEKQNHCLSPSKIKGEDKN